ncbi:hypothetical protein [Kordia sp.]|uniref:hypothetical protein n=1 Tax=Kordia sp. TaxID=1965332 RepID=UPI003D2C2868
MKKKKIKNLSLRKKKISNLEDTNLKGGTIIPSLMFPCISIDWCPSLHCSEGRLCTAVP